ncbi:hypothetical protein D3C78_1055230 [compost metagenome]
MAFLQLVRLQAQGGFYEKGIWRVIDDTRIIIIIHIFFSFNYRCGANGWASFRHTRIDLWFASCSFFYGWSITY